MRVLVTGIGVVSALGCGWPAFCEAVRAGRSGLGDLTLFEPPGGCEHAGEVSGYDWKAACLSKQTYADRCTQLAMGAAREALAAAGAVPVSSEAGPVGLCLGTRWGCLDSAERFFAPVAEGKGKTASSLVFSHSYPNCPTSFLAIELGLRGYSTSFAGHPAAGLWALRSAFDALRAGTADRLLAGAVDALAVAAVAHDEKAGVLPVTRGLAVPEGPDLPPEPWARVPAEGAVFFHLETETAAAQRGAAPLALLELIEGGEADAPCARLGAAAAAGPLLRLLLAFAAGERAPVAGIEEAPGRRIAAKLRAGE